VQQKQGLPMQYLNQNKIKHQIIILREGHGAMRRGGVGPWRAVGPRGGAAAVGPVGPVGPMGPMGPMAPLSPHIVFIQLLYIRCSCLISCGGSPCTLCQSRNINQTSNYFFGNWAPLSHPSEASAGRPPAAACPPSIRLGFMGPWAAWALWAPLALWTA